MYNTKTEVMEKIIEDYISFEIAKLLKEKGFDEHTWTWYTGKGKFCFGKNHFDDYHMNHLSNMASAIDKNKCSAPTLQLVMKWLRKAHNICITIYPDKEKGYEAVLYDIKDDVEIVLQSFGIYGIHIFEDSYEQACETAIKYCLENLI